MTYISIFILLAAVTPAGHLAMVTLGFNNKDIYCLNINHFDAVDMDCYGCRVITHHWPVF